MYFSSGNLSYSIRLLFPFRNPTKLETEYFGGISKSICTWSGHTSVSYTHLDVYKRQPLYTYLLVPNGLGYLQTIVFILVIAALVQLLETALRKYMPPLYNACLLYTSSLPQSAIMKYFCSK